MKVPPALRMLRPLALAHEQTLKSVPSKRLQWFPRDFHVEKLPSYTNEGY